MNSYIRAGSLRGQAAAKGVEAQSHIFKAVEKIKQQQEDFKKYTGIAKLAYKAADIAINDPFDFNPDTDDIYDEITQYGESKYAELDAAKSSFINSQDRSQSTLDAIDNLDTQMKSIRKYLGKGADSGQLQFNEGFFGDTISFDGKELDYTQVKSLREKMNINKEETSDFFADFMGG